MKTPILSLVAALSLAFATGATAAEPFVPKGMPKFGADRPLPIPEIAQKTLANGLAVWVLPRRGGNPKVDLVLAVRGGKAADPLARPAMSDLLADLLVEGTSNRDSVRIAEDLQALGATLTASAGNEGISLRAAGIASGAESLALLLADVARHANFPAAEIELAKSNAMQALKAAEAEASYQADNAFDEVVYGDHPYARTRPTEASIGSTDRAALVTAHAARFRPDRALLVIAGPITGERGFALAEKAFGDWKVKGKAIADVPKPEPTRLAQRVFVERAGSVQSAVRIGRPGFAAGNADEIPATIANAVLGGDFSSRLSRVLREEKGYTYGAYSAFSTYRLGGAFAASADVRNEVTGDAVGEFRKQMQMLVDTPVAAEELNRAKRSVAGNYLFRNQLQGAVAASLANGWLLGRPPEYLGEYVGRTNQVTAAQVQAIATKYFDPKQLSIVVVGDQAVVAQLTPYGKFVTKSK
ncbi:MAG TPA: pitrilysin family protein [Dokdonella sp.]|uniref:M16 family metallopeptidase n=1 Tax=Dokdonella sp. TaxID=2291710 RepID=UPI0025C4AE7C|nr:pitrilysin family protein [Dokdonella sp.]MBX3691968.1 insulinase family protein [Dokdonella sp.]MCW5568355.1 insulinase family protein [Dokdonella sp.]HNR92724.1 pitrilysin family protein [Dokdonella sp.]